MDNTETNQITSSSEDGVNGGSGSSEQDEQGSNESDEYSESDNNKKQSSAVTADVYEDYSRLPPMPHNPAEVKGTATKEPTFPVKLHMILSNPEHEDIIAWLPRGRSWRVLKQKEFQDKVIPLYFRHGRYASFARQVNGWGFKRIMSGCDYNSYYHPMFLRGLPHLTERIKRLTPKDMAARQQETPGPPPDFYAISRKYPLPDSSPAPTSGGAIRLPPAFAGSSAAPTTSFCQSEKPAAATQTELQQLEKRRMDLLGRLTESVAGAPTSSAPNGTAAAAPAVQPPSSNSDPRNSADPGMDSIQALLSLMGNNNAQQQPMAPPRPAQKPPDVMALLEQLLMLSSQLPNGLQSLIELVHILSQDNQEVQQQAPAPVQPPQPVAPPPPPPPPVLSQGSNGNDGLLAALMQLSAMNGGNANTSSIVGNNGRPNNYTAPNTYAQAPTAPLSSAVNVPMGFPPNLGSLLGQNAPPPGVPAAPNSVSNGGNSNQDTNDLLNSILSSLQPRNFGS